MELDGTRAILFFAFLAVGAAWLALAVVAAWRVAAWKGLPKRPVVVPITSVLLVSFLTPVPAVSIGAVALLVWPWGSASGTRPWPSMTFLVLTVLAAIGLSQVF